ncbi:MAG: cysteine hydrolase [Acidimicrobiia bacterium]|nr:cysteine hydrolase [Acidimicrobiia bacterium]
MHDPASALVHDWHIDQREYERHQERRGRRHAFEVLDHRRTALVVVDMIPFFVEENPYARGIVANIERLAEALRAAGGVVAWVVPGADLVPPARVEFLGPAVAERYRTSGGSGTPRARLWHEFDVGPDDLVLEKSSPGAFFPGRCELPHRLEDLGVDTVVVTGTVANVCCESTVREASVLGYRVVMVADANAAVRDEDLNATLHTVYRSFGDVRTTDEVIGLLGVDPPVP